MSVSKEENSFHPEFHTWVGLVCHGAYRSRWDGDWICGTNHQTGKASKPLFSWLFLWVVPLGLSGSCECSKHLSSSTNFFFSSGHCRHEGAEIRGGGDRKQLFISCWSGYHHWRHKIREFSPIYQPQLQCEYKLVVFRPQKSDQTWPQTLATISEPDPTN